MPDDTIWKTIKDRLNEQLDSFIDGLNENLRQEVAQAVNDLSIVTERLLMEPDKAAQWRQDAKHVYNRLESHAALQRLQAAQRLNNAIHDVIRLMSGVLVEVLRP